MSEAQPVPSATRPARSRLRANTIANYVGRGWSTVIGLVCLPMFLALLGREAYGLIGAFAVVQAWALLLDFGLTPTLNREIVRARGGARSWQSLADLVRSVELLVALLASLMAVTVYLAAPALAMTWLTPRAISAATVIKAISFMGLLAATRWIEQVYRGAIQGSEDQIWLNLVQAAVETARWFGALLLLRLVAADILLFFAWNFVVSLASVTLLRRRVGRFLRAHGITAARPQLGELIPIRHFAGGMFLSSVLAFLLTQTDKLIVGSHSDLATFGLYMLAATASAGLLQLVQPMNVAILPRFTALVEVGERDALATAFHTGAQWLAMVVLPVGLLIILLPEQAMLAWTGQPGVAAGGAFLLSLLMAASVVNALANMPYMLQLAHGWTALSNKVNVAGLAALLPVMWWMTATFGGAGAAATLVALNLLSLAVTSSIALARLLPGHRLRWARDSVVMPVGCGTTAALVLRSLLPRPEVRLSAFVELGLAAIVIAASVLLVLPIPRRSLVTMALRRR